MSEINSCIEKETPPRAWGRHDRPRQLHRRCGNTPTGVGKTSANLSSSIRGGKHPHGRGEDLPQSKIKGGSAETPPRAWGRPLTEVSNKMSGGNTPTGVGKTKEAKATADKAKKHPHGRGEDDFAVRCDNDEQETPPRAWGRPTTTKNSCRRIRNTPTGVGKTSRSRHCRARGQKHPHGRGEDTHMKCNNTTCPETPPRAWGRHLYPGKCHRWIRNTPTGVGKT